MHTFIPRIHIFEHLSASISPPEILILELRDITLHERIKHLFDELNTFLAQSITWLLQLAHSISTLACVQIWILFSESRVEYFDLRQTTIERSRHRYLNRSEGVLLHIRLQWHASWIWYVINEILTIIIITIKFWVVWGYIIIIVLIWHQIVSRDFLYFTNMA